EVPFTDGPGVARPFLATQMECPHTADVQVQPPPRSEQGTPRAAWWYRYPGPIQLIFEAVAKGGAPTGRPRSLLGRWLYDLDGRVITRLSRPGKETHGRLRRRLRQLDDACFRRHA